MLIRLKYVIFLRGIKRYFFQKRIVLILNIIMMFILTSITVFTTYDYFKEVVERKSEYSVPARFDQLSILLEDFTESPTTFLLGKGLGNTIQKETEYRDYSDSIYFELQAVYVLNQVGIIYLCIFLVTSLMFMIHFWRLKLIILLYSSYLVYGFTNPYIFDSTNVIVIIVLSSYSKMLIKEGYLK